MKKVLPLIPFLLIFLNTDQSDFGLDPEFEVPEIYVNTSETELVANKGVVELNGELFSGYTLSYYDEDQSKVKTQKGYLEGKRHGLTKAWYSDGQLKQEVHYADNKMHGSKIAWWPDGSLQSQYQMLMGVPHGELLEWYESGELFRKRNFVHGKEEGLQQAFRKNGKLYVNYESKDGRIFGLKKAELCFEIDENQEIKS